MPPFRACGLSPLPATRCRNLTVDLAADPGKMADTGTATASWELARRYGFTDTDGTTPDWGSYARENL